TVELRDGVAADAHGRAVLKVIGEVHALAGAVAGERVVRERVDAAVLEVVIDIEAVIVVPGNIVAGDGEQACCGRVVVNAVIGAVALDRVVLDVHDRVVDVFLVDAGNIHLTDGIATNVAGAAFVILIDPDAVIGGAVSGQGVSINRNV